eukprot:5885572-Pyramimonas_sp.AAC.1
MAEERPNAQGEEEELKPPPEKRKKQKKDPTRRLCPRGGANKVIYEYVVNQKLITDEAELDQFCERQTFSIHMHEVQSRYKQWCEPTFSKHREDPVSAASSGIPSNEGWWAGIQMAHTRVGELAAGVSARIDVGQ